VMLQAHRQGVPSPSSGTSGCPAHAATHDTVVF
jgi:hypothetical protein